MFVCIVCQTVLSQMNMKLCLEIKKEKSSKKFMAKKAAAGHYGLWTVYCHSFSPIPFAGNVLIISVKRYFFFLSINCTNYFLLPASNVIQIFFFFWRNFHYFALNRLTAFKKWVSFFFVGWLFVYTSRTKKKKLSFLPDFQLINHSNWLLQLQDRNFRSKTICRDLS